MLPIITRKEAELILKAENDVQVSLDLEITRERVHKRNGFACVRNQEVSLQQISKTKENACYILEENCLKKIASFSEETNLYYKLVPTADWPTITLSSTAMHRHINISPKQDTLSKIKEISPVMGKVLDTCCGLGYTAIVVSKNAEWVYTFEKDESVLFMAKLNPYSQELFNNKRILIFKKDVSKEITKFKENFFDRIIHDPPTFKYAPELYNKQFYSELFKVLKRKGILYHYAPWPHKMKGKTFYKKIINNLKECGFTNVHYKEACCGIRALKP